MYVDPQNLHDCCPRTEGVWYSKLCTLFRQTAACLACPSTSKWRQYITLNWWWISTGLHGITSLKIVLLVVTTVRTSNWLFNFRLYLLFLSVSLSLAPMRVHTHTHCIVYYCMLINLEIRVSTQKGSLIYHKIWQDVKILNRCCKERGKCSYAFQVYSLVWQFTEMNFWAFIWEKVNHLSVFTLPHRPTPSHHLPQQDDISGVASACTWVTQYLKQLVKWSYFILM